MLDFLLGDGIQYLFIPFVKFTHKFQQLAFETLVEDRRALGTAIADGQGSRRVAGHVASRVEGAAGHRGSRVVEGY